MLEQRQGDEDFMAALEIVVEILKENGSGFLVEQIAQRLENKGLYELARRVRAMDGGDDIHTEVTTTR